MGFNVMEERVIVGNENRGCLWSFEVIEWLWENREGMNMEWGVGLVEDGEVGVEDRDVEYLIRVVVRWREWVI